jgi:hypothetical protein
MLFNLECRPKTATDAPTPVLAIAIEGEEFALTIPLDLFTLCLKRTSL